MFVNKVDDQMRFTINEVDDQKRFASWLMLREHVLKNVASSSIDNMQGATRAMWREFTKLTITDDDTRSCALCIPRGRANDMLGCAHMQQPPTSYFIFPLMFCSQIVAGKV
ncbi:hypothetical protein AURDEDRAFT_167848 [Auricularia subglabra TFB-10046 SS5]|nr:hypothetical protein AURDEDRAFT_167848 [Auricularia subglabra TFB-10046 SS5]